MIRRLVVEVPLHEYDSGEPMVVPRSDPQASWAPWHTFQVRVEPLPHPEGKVLLEVWQEWRSR